MFTGIVEEVGKVRTVLKTNEGATLTICAARVLDGTRIGDSINTNGVCLTVVKSDGATFTVEAIAETLRRSNLGDLKQGDRLNLERAMAVGDRLGGHIVQGHVDATAMFISKRPEGDSAVYRFGLPENIARYVVLKGSIAINGISLTVAGLSEGWFEVAIIPHTIAETNIGDVTPGSRVNLEVDILAKYIERLLAGRIPEGQSQSNRSTLTAERMRELGY